jgi:hypothetical protein
MVRTILLVGNCMAIRSVEGAQDCCRNEQATDDQWAYVPHERIRPRSVTTPGLVDRSPAMNPVPGRIHPYANREQNTPDSTFRQALAPGSRRLVHVTRPLSRPLLP